MSETRKRKLEEEPFEGAKRQKPLETHRFAIFAFDCSVTLKGGAIQSDVSFIKTTSPDNVPGSITRHETKDKRRHTHLQQAVRIKSPEKAQYALLRLQCFKRERDDGTWELAVEMENKYSLPSRQQAFNALGHLLFWKRRDEKTYQHYIYQVKKMQRNCTLAALEIGPSWYQIVKLV